MRTRFRPPPFRIGSEPAPVASVLQTFVGLLQLRAGPQDLPASDIVFLGSITAAVAASLLAVRALFPLDLALARIGLDLLLQAAFVVGALHWRGHPARFRQTYAALCGTGALLVLLIWPLVDILRDRGPGETLSGLAVIGLFGVYAWSVAVIAHILRHALDLRMPPAVLLALGYFIGAAALIETLVPSPPGG